jgi:uncharacterized protein YoxC
MTGLIAFALIVIAIVIVRTEKSLSRIAAALEQIAKDEDMSGVYE